MAKYLNADEVAMLAVTSAERLRMKKIPSADSLVIVLKQRNPMPKVFSDGIVRMWVDKLYVAYSYEFSDKVHYIYVTDCHINEEVRSYAVASILRKKEVSLPRDILGQFYKAIMMICTANDEKRYVILKNLIVNDSFDCI